MIVLSETLSVIIPCRNAARYLDAALASVRAQTLAPDEVIVVDDGSSDDSTMVAGAVPGVRVCKQEPLGIAAARNAGIAATQGTVIAFLDADDVWPAESLAQRMAALQQDSSLAGVYGRVIQFVSSELTGGDSQVVGIPVYLQIHPVFQIQ